MINTGDPQCRSLFGFIDICGTGVGLARDVYRATTDNSTATGGNAEFG